MNICPNCGASITYIAYHVCPSQTAKPPHSRPLPAVHLQPDHNARIAVALERIADALEEHVGLERAERREPSGTR